MGVTKVVMLCLAFAVVVNAQPSIFGDLASKENQLNCLLGKPNCVQPAPPPKDETPPPEPSPETSPPAPEPSPEEAPSEAPVPAPAPSPDASGTAIVAISLQFPAGYTVTDDVRKQLADLIQQALGSAATVELSIATGRKLLAETLLTLTLGDIKSCKDVLDIIEKYITDGTFVKDAQADGIPLQAASIIKFSCTGPDGSVDFNGAPAPAPYVPPSTSPSTPTGGPSPGSPTGSSPSPGPGPAGR